MVVVHAAAMTTEDGFPEGAGAGVKVAINIERVKHQLRLYDMSVEELLVRVGEGLKNAPSPDDVLAPDIELNILKRIDKVFHRGLTYYLDPSPPVDSPTASIFFRKQSFDTPLDFGSRHVVRKIEDLKVSLSVMATLADLQQPRTFRKVLITESAFKVAQEFRVILHPGRISGRRQFLVRLIEKLAEVNVLVLEFVESHNAREKAGIDGFFLQPHVIVLKRQRGYAREIFTLAHEIAHYLLDMEEVEQVDPSEMLDAHAGSVERWCNDFAYHFLAGPADASLRAYDVAGRDAKEILPVLERLAAETHLSTTALMTRLRMMQKVSREQYEEFLAFIDEMYRRRTLEEKQERQMRRDAGAEEHFSAPRPIHSPMLIATVQAAYHEGVISATEASAALGVKPERLAAILE